MRYKFEESITPLQEENMKRLIAALMSGDYKQIYGLLGTPDGNCCLGVASEILGVKKKVRTDDALAPLVYCYVYDEDNIYDSSPDEDWFNKNYPNPMIDGTDLIDRLMSINDSKSYSFKEIGELLQTLFFDGKEIIFNSKDSFEII